MNNLEVFYIDDISYRLKGEHSFEWIKNLGKVFCVFDEQDSGNISFGIEKDGIKKFVKYAGAKTIEFQGDPKDAIATLKKSIILYQELKHPHLIKLLDHFETEKGYVLIFEWFDGECLHSHWSFPPPQKYEHPDSPFFLFKNLPVESRLKSIKCILEFHKYVENKGYVAVDFYDGSILYDFKSNIAKICDIDLYKKKPFQNKMGRLWGSSRFMSPEEFELGAVIDERTNVFNMGAMAFCLLGGELDHSFSKWDANEALYEVALKAVEKDRSKRYLSVSELCLAWNLALQGG
ncbi:protein kinase domain-containing protein [Saliterribacillus persicus]|uniref:Serine/threonine protein kinase n=1 Tax=Saliterribacillus persicus TaxID=930114 RepID=A0A368X7J8_9BACI|nr:protein kinase [Saliterribacillus persicus]RCW63933.1 serine/threonine protein kinase [Saliterribacillus persicus]